MKSAPIASRPWRAGELERARGLGAHRDRHPPGGFVDHRLGDATPLVEGHGREVAGRAAGQERAVALVDAALDQEADGRRIAGEVDRQVGVAEHGRDGDVAALEPLPRPLESPSQPPSSSPHAERQHGSMRGATRLDVPRPLLDPLQPPSEVDGDVQRWTRATMPTEQIGFLLLPGVPDLRPHPRDRGAPGRQPERRPSACSAGTSSRPTARRSAGNGRRSTPTAARRGAVLPDRDRLRRQPAGAAHHQPAAQLAPPPRPPRRPVGALDTGAFTLAAAGLLDGYRVTLHWEAMALFRERYPEIAVAEQLFAVDRNRSPAPAAWRRST